MEGCFTFQCGGVGVVFEMGGGGSFLSGGVHPMGGGHRF